MGDLLSLRPPRWRPETTRGIVFDLDGTLIDSYDAITDSLNHARSRFGLPPHAVEEVRRRVGHGLEHLIEDDLGAGRVEEGVRLFRSRYGRIFLDRTHVLPGVLDGLARLGRAGMRMSLASNKPARFGEPLAERLGFLGYLDVVMGPDRAGSTKPEPTMIRLCLEAMGAERSAGLYVGDMVLDVESATRAGVPVALVAGGSSSLDALRATGEAVFESFGALVDRLVSEPTDARTRT